jgi:hypothetical protein
MDILRYIGTVRRCYEHVISAGKVEIRVWIL